MTAAARKVAKRPQKPVYLRFQRMADPDTGELVMCLRARGGFDRRILQDAGYKQNTEVRAELKRPRNIKFHRMAHAMGALAVDHCEGFEGMDTHDALKKLQRESGVCCDIGTIDLDLTSMGIGIIKAPISTPQSIAFDSMPEEDFAKLVHGICAHLTEKYKGVPPSEISEIIAAIEDGHA